MINILLCGGCGTRLWPISREYHPKQFCKLIGKHSAYQETLLRNSQLCEKTIVITNTKHFSLAKAQAEEIQIQNIEFILESIGRNTAPAITIACLTLNEDDIVFVTPSDHYINNGIKYKEALKKAKILAEDDCIVTFGIKPSHPETGFGYIETDGENVISFKEKPDFERASKFIEKGDHFWNSGMFVFKVKTYLNEIKQHSKNTYTASKEAFKYRKSNNNVISIPKPFMEKIPANSIDYAVLEKSKIIKMLALDIKWSDLGSFEAVYKLSIHDRNGNVSPPKSIFIDSKNNFIASTNRQIVLIDVENLIIIETEDAILISKNGSSHKIKDQSPKLENNSPNITKK